MVITNNTMEEEEEDSLTKTLGRGSVLYYGVGHMLNDITSACWFTYLLVFLTDINLSPRDAAIIMFSGQIADGFATIFAGEMIDRFGHFKLWHGAGSILVAFSFSSVFGGCLPCKVFGTNSSTVQTVGYSTFAAIFNVGWAATQVSHMAMVNCITLNPSSRVVLASCRNAFTMVANLTLYAVAFLVFSLSKPHSIADIENQYRWIVYFSIAIGCCFIIVFHFGTKEPRLKTGVLGKKNARIAWAYWFKKVLYYQVALVYLLTRLVTNVSQAFLAFYVINDLQMSQSSKALVPAIIYICSFFVSVTLQEMTWTGHRLKYFYSVGGLLWIFCGDWTRHAKRSCRRRCSWLCLCLWILEFLRQNLMWDRFVFFGIISNSRYIFGATWMSFSLWMFVGYKIWCWSCTSYLCSCWGDGYLHHEFKHHPIIKASDRALVGIMQTKRQIKCCLGMGAIHYTLFLYFTRGNRLLYNPCPLTSRRTIYVV